jgi:divalent metal cation (Fe/Co/Zn/Cd) transporter
MCLSGPTILFVALFSSNIGNGNVIPGLVIAVLGIIVNSWFWLRYRKFDQKNLNAIFAVQSKLYLAKSFVDACVTLALVCVVVAPAAPATRYVDLFGSIIVAVYLVMNGMTTIRGRKAPI